MGREDRLERYLRRWENTGLLRAPRHRSSPAVTSITMPELPEVETIRAALDPELAGATVTEAWGHPSAKFAQAPAAIGRRFVSVGRRGKYLLADLSSPPDPHGAQRRTPHTELGPPADSQLVVHLGMTGVLSLRPSRTPGTSHMPPEGDHVRAWWALDDRRTLVFSDVRRFGRLAVVAHGDYSGLPTLAALGPEPFDPMFSPSLLRAGVNATSRTIKTALLSQRIVAGLGNIYVDESLWRARIDPRRRTGLGRHRAEALHGAIVDVLAEAVDEGGTTLRDYRMLDGSTGEHQHRLEVYGRAGLPCLRCGSTLRSTVVDARTTVWCGSCQR